MKTSQSGRSMVEILGVLAIMGVLSVGGIAGYTTAMIKYRTNEILSGIRDRALAISAYQGFGQGTAPDLLAYKDQKLKGYDVTLYPNTIEGSDFAIQIEKVDHEMCERIAEQGLVSAVLVRPNLCDDKDDNTLIFGFKNDLAGRENSRGAPGSLSSQPQPGEELKACESGVKEGALQCRGYMVQKCRDDGTGNLNWYDKENCLYGCSGGVCLSRECSQEGQTKCRGDSILTCQSGQWTQTKSCDWQCEEGKCSEECNVGDDYYRLALSSGVYEVYYCSSSGVYTQLESASSCTTSDYDTCLRIQNDLIQREVKDSDLK